MRGDTPQLCAKRVALGVRVGKGKKGDLKKTGQREQCHPPTQEQSLTHLTVNDDQTDTHFPQQQMLLFMGVTYFWPPTLAKLSLIVLFHRINPNRRFRLILYAIAFTCTVYTLVFTIVLSVPCNPLHAGTTTCLNNLALAQAICNISADGVLIIMPMVTLWGLQMARKQKIAVWCILALGSAYVALLLNPYLLQALFADFLCL